jgi:hypothetical protein
MVEGLHVIGGKVLKLINEESSIVQRGALKYKERNLQNVL